jgi:hypothetical protein
MSDNTQDPSTTFELEIVRGPSPKDLAESMADNGRDMLLVEFDVMVKALPFSPIFQIQVGVIGMLRDLEKPDTITLTLIQAASAYAKGEHYYLLEGAYDTLRHIGILTVKVQRLELQT